MITETAVDWNWQCHRSDRLRIMVGFRIYFGILPWQAKPGRYSRLDARLRASRIPGLAQPVSVELTRGGIRGTAESEAGQGRSFTRVDDSRGP